MALPLEPQIVEADTLQKAFSKVKFADLDELKQVPASGKSILYWEAGTKSGIDAQHIFERRDVPLSRKRWQFDVRREYHAYFLPAKGFGCGLMLVRRV